jgi:hypothetical protein
MRTVPRVSSPFLGFGSITVKAHAQRQKKDTILNGKDKKRATLMLARPKAKEPKT